MSCLDQPFLSWAYLNAANLAADMKRLGYYDIKRY